MTRVAVFGNPVAHSLSPAMHTAAFRALGLHWHYGKRRVTASRLRAELRRAAARGWRGVNLTVSLKEKALGCVDRLTPEARRAGAVNTVTFEAGSMEGHSTDGEGFLRSLRGVRGFDPRGRRIAILGAGGAARSVAFALAGAGARSLTILNRHPRRARLLARKVAGSGGVRTAGGGIPRWTGWRRILRRTDMLVNATSVGLHGEPSPVPREAMRRGLRVVDLIYNPPVTGLLREARAAGARTMNGEGMLVHQGALALERWSGRRVPVRVMARALARALGKASRPLQNRYQGPLRTAQGSDIVKS